MNFDFNVARVVYNFLHSAFVITVSLNAIVYLHGAFVITVSLNAIVYLHTQTGLGSSHMKGH